MNEEDILTSDVDVKPVGVVKPREPGSLIKDANSAAERLENANKELGLLLDRQRLQSVEDTLAGGASAGNPAPSVEELEIEGAKKLLEGTGLEGDAFPDMRK